MKKNKSHSGFSLIELLVVTTIIIVLTTIGLVSFQNTSKKTRDAKRKSDLESIRQALVLYKTDTGAYPDNAFSWSTMVVLLNTEGYFSEPVLSDPKDALAHPDTACSNFGYSYAGVAGGATFTISAKFENTAQTSSCDGTCVYLCSLSNP